MNVRYIAALAVLLLFLSLPFAHATAVTVDIYGTNVSNAQSNLTKTGNNTYQVVQWAIGDTTKSLKADINGNASDDITFTLHNFTVGRVVEVKVNGSAFNAYQADSTGTISFTRVQTVKNQTYSFTPAVNTGGYNTTWAQFWTFPSLLGSNFTQYFLARNDSNVYAGDTTITVTRQSNSSYSLTASTTSAYGQAYNTSTSLAFGASAAWYPVEFDANTNLNGTNHSVGFQPERFAVNSSGVYRVHTILRTLETSTTGNIHVGRVLLNGATEVPGSYSESYVSTTQNTISQSSADFEVYLSANDYLVLQIGVSSTNERLGTYDDANLPDATTPISAMMTIVRIG